VARPSIKRLTGKRLQRLRGHIRDQQPLCLKCLEVGVLKEWEELDHITPYAKGGDDSLDNLQGLCKAHHAAKTATDMGYRITEPCGLDGFPSSPDHHWNRRGGGVEG